MDRHRCSMEHWPLFGGVHTVAGFDPIEGLPGIYLYELPRVDCECSKLINAPWPLDIFEPLDERKTDISDLRQLLEPLVPSRRATRTMCLRSSLRS